MEIQNPRRALAVSLHSDKDHLSRTLQEDSLAGTTHDLKLKTKYYSATVPIWLDLIDDAEEWASSFLSTEASEVLAVLGGLILVFSLPTAQDDPAADKTRQLITHVGKVVHQGLGGWEWDGVKLAVGVGAGNDVDEWDELCAEAGLEFVQLGGNGQDRMQQFGEKSGIPRVKEALEANEWDQVDGDGGVDLPSDDDENDNDTSSSKPDPENMDFGLGQAPDLESLKKAIWAGAAAATTATAEEEDAKDREVGDRDMEENQDIGDEDVAKVEAMMRKLQAAREAGETMSETQRRKMAAKAVEEVMREL